MTLIGNIASINDAVLTGNIAGIKGDTGVGIASITENDDYTITIALTDGSTFTTEPIAGFTSIVVNDSGNLVVTKTDGTTVTLDIGLSEYQTAIEGYKNDAQTSAGTATTQALKAEGNAVGKQNGTDVASGSEYYHNNSKYYSQQASASATAAATSATNAAASETAVSGVKTQLQNRMTAIETEQTTQDARMDSFVTLAEGSTTGDAELADIRVGADGVTYTNAGGAVRGQITDLKSDLMHHPIGDTDIVASMVDCGLLQKTVDNTQTWAFTTKTTTLPSGRYLLALYDLDMPSIGWFAGGTTVQLEDVIPRTTSFGLYQFTLYGQTEVVWKMQVSTSSPVAAGTYHVRYSVYDASSEIIPKVITGVDGLEERKVEKIYSKNIFDRNDQNNLDNYYVLPSGGIATNQYTSNFFVTGYIPVEENKPYSVSPNVNNEPISIAFYDANKHFLSSYTYNSVGRSYNLMSPENAEYARFTGLISNKEITMFEQNSVITNFVEYSEYAPVSELKRQVEEIVQSGFHEASMTEVASLASGGSIELVVPDIKQNNQISFYARLGSFTDITISHGKTQPYASGYVVVDSTSIQSYQYTDRAVLKETYNHGLTFTDFVSVIICVKNLLNAEVTVTTGNGGKYKCNISWNGNYGNVVATLNGGSLTKCGLTFTCYDYKKDVWAFGDSYFDMWPQIANTNGADNWLLDGSSGRGSISAYASLTKALQHGHPKAILWCLGMNDGDTASAINSNWKTVADNLIDLCESKNIELILATVPNTPTINNSFKNAYVKASGKRYVDICEAVGADIDTSWYNGLLSGDNVHPTNTGRQAIAYRVMSDVPEIMC